MEKSLDEIKEVLDEVDALDLPDGAHWQMCCERLGMDIDDLAAIICDNGDFFGAVPM